MSHAIVGTLTGGRILYIRIDSREGGETKFNPSRPPIMALTLPAGYIGSCVIGCGLILAGFDTLASKYASLALGVWIGICLLVCALIMPKLYVTHHYSRFRMYLSRLTCRAQSAQRHRERAEKDEDGSYKDKMVSLDIIVGCTLLLLILVALGWYFSDSIGLRFIILFVGTMSATYSLWDVYTDGVIHGEEGGRIAMPWLSVITNTTRSGTSGQRNTTRYYGSRSN